MHTGWLTTEDGTYYLPKGKMAFAWQKIDGKTYYFIENGTMTRGFWDIDGSRYYFDEDGALVTGFREIEGQHYFFREDGVMHTGWLESEESRRYFLSDGRMAVGWQVINELRYFFREDGLPFTGWYQEGEYRYYFLPEGMAAVGQQKIDGALHYFTPKGIEVILVNANHAVPGYYERTLKQVTGYHYVDQRCYDALMRMLGDCEAAGVKYVFNSAYRSKEEQQLILDTRTQEHMENYELDYKEAREKALRTVAYPGTSEHHLGLAVDLLGEAAQAWLHEHCWDYGFIVRYYDEKEAYTGITGEPWHFCYVGTEVSLELKDSGLSLEEYLGADPVKPWLMNGAAE